MQANHLCYIICVIRLMLSCYISDNSLPFVWVGIIRLYDNNLFINPNILYGGYLNATSIHVADFIMLLWWLKALKLSLP